MTLKNYVQEIINTYCIIKDQNRSLSEDEINHILKLEDLAIKEAMVQKDEEWK